MVYILPIGRKYKNQRFLELNKVDDFKIDDCYV